MDVPRDRKTAVGISVEQRIKNQTTLFFTDRDEAYTMARELHSYVFPCFEYVNNQFTQTGHCVPK